MNNKEKIDKICDKLESANVQGLAYGIVNEVIDELKEEFITPLSRLKAEMKYLREVEQLVGKDAAVASDLRIENAKLKEKIKHIVSEINFAIPKIRRWDTNANSVFYTDLNTAGNILSRILADLPEEQNEYLKSVGQL